MHFARTSIALRPDSKYCSIRTFKFAVVLTPLAVNTAKEFELKLVVTPHEMGLCLRIDVSSHSPLHSTLSLFKKYMGDVIRWTVLSESHCAPPLHNVHMTLDL